MRNEHIKVGQIVPPEIRLEIYKKVLPEAIASATHDHIEPPFLCLALPIKLWGLKDEYSEGPDRREWSITVAKTMFPELGEELRGNALRGRLSMEREHRVKFLQDTIKALENGEVDV